MVRVISQEAYDELVFDSMVLYNDLEEAVNETIALLKAQGVDLTNIITDLVHSYSHDHLVSLAIVKLKELWSQPEHDIEKIQDEVNAIKTECNKGIAYKLKAGKDGAYPLFLDIVEHCLNNTESADLSKLSICTMNALLTLMTGQPDILDKRGDHLIRRILDEQPTVEIVIETLQCATVCCEKHEQNRQRLFAKDILKNIIPILSQISISKVACEVQGEEHIRLLRSVLALTRSLCLDDDIRVQFGKAHEHAREIAIHTLDTLVKILRVELHSDMCFQVMWTIATLLVRNEFCQTAADAGCTEMLVEVLKKKYNDTQAVQYAFKLVKALAGNDDVKRLFIKNGIAPIIVSVIHENKRVALTPTLGMKCISALSLREPTHALQFIEHGAADVIVDSMKLYPNDVSLQRAACWAIRNLVARSKEQNVKFLELGAEELLNDACSKFDSELGFDAKSALRDLECEVEFQEQWTGKGGEIEND